MDLLERIKDRTRALVLEKGGVVALVVGDLGLLEDDRMALRTSATGFFLDKDGTTVLSIDPAPDKALADLSAADVVFVYQTPSDGAVVPVAAVPVAIGG